MISPRCFLLPLVLLAGCTGSQGSWPQLAWPWPAAGNAPSATSATQGVVGQAGRGYGAFNFDWMLSGDSRIMPLQVFDDGARMWLQFTPVGAWPAVFEVGPAGRRPLAYQREEPYMVLPGVYEQLELRGGHLQGSIRRQRAAARAHTASTPVDVAPAVDLDPAPVLVPVTESVPAPVPVPGTQAAPTSVSASATVSASASGPASVSGSARVAESPAVLPVAGPAYAVSPDDQTIRQALERWAARSGCTFNAEHWAVDVDIPLVASARFDVEFKSDVRALLGATEMGDRPLQPCFYSNRVLRVVAHAQSCDRRSSPASVS